MTSIVKKQISKKAANCSCLAWRLNQKSAELYTDRWVGMIGNEQFARVLPPRQQLDCQVGNKRYQGGCAHYYLGIRIDCLIGSQALRQAKITVDTGTRFRGGNFTERHGRRHRRYDASLHCKCEVTIQQHPQHYVANQKHHFLPESMHCVIASLYRTPSRSLARPRTYWRSTSLRAQAYRSRWDQSLEGRWGQNVQYW